jgi:hypothetical protein
MTIKQQGGIFGRNPTFNNVTIEGELTFDGDIDINSDLKIDGDLEVTGTSKLTGNVGIGKSSGVQSLEVQGEALFGSGTDGIKLTYSGGNSTGIIDTGYTSTGLEFRVGNVKKVILNSSGNLEMNSGSGIDFSATAGTGTSELFDDYEEGTWTPNQGAGLTVSGTFSSAGLYTRIGRQVNVTGKVTGSTNINSSVSGVICTNLPFVVLAASNSVGVMTNTATNNTNMYVNPGTSTAYSSEAAGVSGSLYFSVTYYAT